MRLINHKAPVHKSLLEVIGYHGVPMQAVFGNVVQTFVITVMCQYWRYPLVGLALHGVLWRLTKDDPNRIYKLWRYCGYRSYYRPG